MKMNSVSIILLIIILMSQSAQAEMLKPPDRADFFYFERAANVSIRWQILRIERSNGKIIMRVYDNSKSFERYDRHDIYEKKSEICLSESDITRLINVLNHIGFMEMPETMRSGGIRSTSSDKYAIFKISFIINGKKYSRKVSCWNADSIDLSNKDVMNIILLDSYIDSFLNYRFDGKLKYW